MKPKIVKTTGTVYKWICPECGKVIQTLYMGQTESLIGVHMGKHTRAKKEAKNE